ncbi:hypothetical protein B0H10DRAFT_2078880 [Mycena sp. CBHHK59/15]|nr:hypothetical protein B0H10DRAFT_2078880 [Mycena sp. CBHHK59/15]
MLHPVKSRRPRCRLVSTLNGTRLRPLARLPRQNAHCAPLRHEFAHAPPGAPSGRPRSTALPCALSCPRLTRPKGAIPAAPLQSSAHGTNTDICAMYLALPETIYFTRRAHAHTQSIADRKALVHVDCTTVS